jgi:hypothetical protein
MTHGRTLRDFVAVYASSMPSPKRYGQLQKEK